MSTPNFALKNASRYFVCRTPQYYTQEYVDECELDQDLVGEYDEDLTIFCYQNSKDNVASELKANGWHDIEECDGRSVYCQHSGRWRNGILPYSRAVLLIIQAALTPGLHLKTYL